MASRVFAEGIEDNVLPGTSAADMDDSLALSFPLSLSSISGVYLQAFSPAVKKRAWGGVGTPAVN